MEEGNRGPRAATGWSVWPRTWRVQQPLATPNELLGLAGFGAQDVPACGGVGRWGERHSNAAALSARVSEVKGKRGARAPMGQLRERANEGVDESGAWVASNVCDALEVGAVI